MLRQREQALISKMNAKYAKLELHSGNVNVNELQKVHQQAYYSSRPIPIVVTSPRISDFHYYYDGGKPKSTTVTKTTGVGSDETSYPLHVSKFILILTPVIMTCQYNERTNQKHSITEKIETIKQLCKCAKNVPSLTQDKLAKDFEISQSTVSVILSESNKWPSVDETVSTSQFKKNRQANWPQLEEL
ncbi:9203_t:CDS:2 [Entrophospora sp. SA101]|nr:9203_t:CDS:2 [Entrophospora sp. SA101]